MVATADAKRHAALVNERLKAAYPEARCALNFATPLELLVATILSAQCTDKRVNIVTRDLFRKYPDARAFATARPNELERDIKTTGFFRAKAKSIQGCCTQLVEHYGGELPQQLEALVALPGVGRKTANVVLGTGFGIATGVVVDTHIGRLSRRLGLSAHTDPVKVERDLMEQLPKREWIDFGHRTIAHGRTICLARRPKCEICTLADICPKIGVAASPVAKARTTRPKVKTAKLKGQRT
jgi:endonuclease-3